MERESITRSLVKLQEEFPNVSETSYEDLLARLYDAASALSDDDNTKNAAAIVSREGKLISLGANGLPPSVRSEPTRLQRPGKYRYFIHAEQYAITSLAFDGLTSRGTTMICPWASCVTCSSLMVAAGIVRLIVHKHSFGYARDIWKKEVADGHQILREANVEIIAIDFQKKHEVTALINGTTVGY